MHPWPTRHCTVMLALLLPLLLPLLTRTCCPTKIASKVRHCEDAGDDNEDPSRDADLNAPEMSQQVIDSLMYDFNHNLFVLKTMLPNVRNLQDRESVVRWMRFLKRSAKNVDELRLRNDFMYYLVLGVQKDSLKPPFDKPPQNLPLMSMVGLLPSPDNAEHQDLWPTSSGDTLATGEAGRGPTRKPEIVHRSPDGGEFLAGQPIPEVGAFCYLALLTKKQN